MAWGGVPLNARTAAMMDEAQALYGATITATQGSPSTSVSASAMTHAGEGVIDVVGADLDAIVAAMRQVGFAAWHRTPAQGFVHHVHGVAVGEPLLDPSAELQVQAYFAGRNGLASNGADDGPRDWVGVTWETYTGGTYVPPPTTGDPVRVWNQYPGDRCGSYLDVAGGTLVGAVTTTPTLTTITYDRGDLTGTSPATVHLTAGDSLMFAALQDWQYGEPAAGLTDGYWILEGTGLANLTLADWFDTGFAYPSVTPAWATAARVGEDSTGVVYFQMDPTFLDSSHLYVDGWPLVRVICTTGTADLTFVGAQVQTASGFWVPDGGSEWSPTVAESTRLVLAGIGDPTYNVTPGDRITNDVWTVDGSPVYLWDPLTPTMDTDHDYSAAGRQVGEGTSLIGPEDAIDLRDADIHATTGGGAGQWRWRLIYDDGMGIIPEPEYWSSSSDGTPQYWTAPTKSELPSTPPGIPFIGYLRSGTYEWLDTDTDILSWVVGPVGDFASGHYIAIEGDAQTVTLFAQTFTSFVDQDAFDQATGETIESWTKTTDDDLNDIGSGTPVYGEFDEYEIVTSDTLLILTIDSTIRTVDAQTDAGQSLLRHTYPSTNDIEGFAGSNVTFSNVPAAPKFRVPPYRYEQPSFTMAPTWVPTITDLEDPSVTYLRNRQRNDGLGGWSTPRTKGTSSRQLSLHNRGYE